MSIDNDAEDTTKARIESQQPNENSVTQIGDLFNSSDSIG